MLNVPHIYSSMPIHIALLPNEIILEGPGGLNMFNFYIGTDTFRRDIVFYFSLLYLLKIKKIAKHSFLYIPDGSSKYYFAAGYILVVVGVFLALFYWIANTLSFFVDSRYNNVESKLTKRTECITKKKKLFGFD